MDNEFDFNNPEAIDAALVEAVDAMEEGGTLLVFLSNHLVGRMGEAALADMERVGRDLLAAHALFVAATGKINETTGEQE